MLADAVWYLKGQGQPAVDALERIPTTERGREAYGIVYGVSWLPGSGGVARLSEGKPVECKFMMRKFPGFSHVLDYLSLDEEIGTININKLMLLHIQDNHNVYGYFREGVKEKLADTQHAQDEQHTKESAEKEQLRGHQIREGMRLLALDVGDKKVSVEDAFNLVQEAERTKGPIKGYSPELPQMQYPEEPWKIEDIEAQYAGIISGVRRG